MKGRILAAHLRATQLTTEYNWELGQLQWEGLVKTYRASPWTTQAIGDEPAGAYCLISHQDRDTRFSISPLSSKVVHLREDR